MTESQIRKRLAREIDRADGVRALSREWGISPTVISMTATGSRKPGPSVLAKLGITATRTVRRSVAYTAATQQSGPVEPESTSIPEAHTRIWSES